MPINDPKAKGVLFGLTMEHDRRHIYRAALEGVGFSLNQNVELMEAVGLPVTHITAVGGGTKNGPWMQIVADIIGRPVYVPAITVGASYGDALMTAIGTGGLKNFSELKRQFKPGCVYHPDPESHEKYTEMAEIYRELYLATKELMHRSS